MMNEQVKKVRNSIKQRKKISSIKGQTSFKEISLIPTNEERLGMLETPPNGLTKSSKPLQERAVTFKRLRYVMIPFIFFIIGTIILSTAHPSINSTQMWLRKQLETEFPFAKVNQWYVTTFGQPNALVPTSSINETEKLIMPVEGPIVETFAVNGNGIKIFSNDKTSVSTFTDGIVIFVGNLKETGKTVIIQHADNSISTYGFLSDVNVFAYQIVNKNDKIGLINPEKVSEPFFFSLEKDNEYIDPTKVIRVDDIP